MAVTFLEYIIYNKFEFGLLSSVIILFKKKLFTLVKLEAIPGQ